MNNQWEVAIWTDFRKKTAERSKNEIIGDKLMESNKYVLIFAHY